jgi:type IV pilus assembly protein PilE
MRSFGYTLIEIVITLLVMSVLAALAVSSYGAYIRRSLAVEAIEQLDAYRTRMEKAFQDNGNYGAGACSVAVPTGVSRFEFSCQLAPDAQTFTARATGSAAMAGYTYSINEQGLRRTEAFPGLAAASDCFMVEKNKCK